jgi:YHS domain-containing protein
MRTLKNLTALLFAVTLLAGPLTVSAADQKADAKPKPYPLKTCIISGDKLGEMGEPFRYVYKGQEIKFCCKNCLKDFNKSPEKYLKQIHEAAAKAKKKES